MTDTFVDGEVQRIQAMLYAKVSDQRWKGDVKYITLTPTVAMELTTFVQFASLATTD